jgi:hypothetical protein
MAHGENRDPSPAGSTSPGVQTEKWFSGWTQSLALPLSKKARCLRQRAGEGSSFSPFTATSAGYQYSKQLKHGELERPTGAGEKQRF